MEDGNSDSNQRSDEGLSGFFRRFFRGQASVEKSEESDDKSAEQEIIDIVNVQNKQGTIDDSEAEMISNILEFDDKDVSDIMTHRRNIIAIDSAMPLRTAAEFMAGERFSRYPVYENDEDNIIGILHIKDVMRVMLDGDMDADIKSVMHEPYFVPDTQSIKKLFKDMQEKKVHMAIVVDEYGQSCGLVAMEDILEEIVGNIQDEYDAEVDNIKCEDGVYYINGLTPLDEVRKALMIEADDDFDTLNGYLISKLDHIPQPQEEISIETDGYTFEVIGVEDNTISKVRAIKNIE